MTHWLLIFWFVVGSMGSFGGVHATAGVADFDDEAACHAAFAAMKATKYYEQGLWGVCVPKATERKP